MKVNITVVGKGEDERGAGGLWDLAGEIAIAIGMLKRVNENDIIYADEWGQETIYNILCEYKK